MIHNAKYGLLGLIALLAFSCARQNIDGQMDELPKVREGQLVKALKDIADQEFDSFYSKISTTYEDTAQKVSFKTSVRMVQDSALNALITFARIPVINALCTPDSVQISNKREKCFIKEDIAFLKSSFGVEMDLIDVEDLILGWPVGFDRKAKYRRTNDNQPYTLCSHTEKDIEKVIQKGKREIIAYYTLNVELNALSAIELYSPYDGTRVKIQFVEREVIEGYIMPKIVTMEIEAPKQTINIEMEYKKTRINQNEEIHFVIPESYGRCE